jgi:hypothetical protein
MGVRVERLGRVLVTEERGDGSRRASRRDEDFHEDEVAACEFVAQFRETLVERFTARKFVGQSISAELRSIPGSGKSGNFDASARVVSVPAPIDNALKVILDDLRRYPYVGHVAKSIVGDSSYGKLDDFVWWAEDLPADRDRPKAMRTREVDDVDESAKVAV